MEKPLRLTKKMREIEAAYDKPLENVLRTFKYDHHLTLAEIAKEIGVPVGTLGGWIVRFGLTRADVATPPDEMAS